MPGIRFFLDYDRRVSALYGATATSTDCNDSYQSHWLLLDPQLRVLGRYSIDQGPNALKHLADALAGMEMRPSWASILYLPNVFEAELCERLIQIYEQNGGEQSGFVRDENGKTVLKLDPSHKVRRDYKIIDSALRQSLVHRVHQRIVPEIQRAFQFTATRIERYIIACYDANEGGHFRPHRDNTTKGTAHRRFAVSINLNAESYDGGNLRFPEFGERTYRAPTGGAVVFSCSLIHEATPITRGRRYAFLPFLYNDAAMHVRKENNQFLGDGVGAYEAH